MVIEILREDRFEMPTITEFRVSRANCRDNLERCLWDDIAQADPADDGWFFAPGPTVIRGRRVSRKES